MKLNVSFLHTICDFAAKHILAVAFLFCVCKAILMMNQMNNISYNYKKPEHCNMIFSWWFNFMFCL